MLNLINIYKTGTLAIICILTLWSGGSVLAQQVQSDYEIQKEFKKQLNSFHQKLEEADSSAGVKTVLSDIDEFEEQYEEHSELLNRALYPDTYDQKIEELKKSSQLVVNRLEMFEEQDTRLTEMKNRLSDYESELVKLDRQSDSLQQAIQKSVQSEKQLSSMVRQYRESLERRDELVLSFIDSLIIAYEKMDLDTGTVEKTAGKYRLESDGNALKMIYAISEENIQLLRNNSEKLRLEDYMRMTEVHSSFDRMWSQMGEKITGVYQSESAEIKAEEISSNVKEWKNLLQEQIFTAFNSSFEEQGIRLPEFSTSEGMYSTITTYLDKEIKASEEGASRDTYERFNRFRDFWTEVELKWASNLRNADILSEEQVSLINQKVYSWSQEAEPKSNLLVYLLGASILAVVSLSFFLVREKTKKR